MGHEMTEIDDECGGCAMFQLGKKQLKVLGPLEGYIKANMWIFSLWVNLLGGE